ncbi:liver carboxylesterase 1 [Ornithorhynchus anatinus]|uniref:Carboxylic ester hydrolase n=1 Tax=Ornithorhynchus anatinus TaxID=9258 RepID=F7BGU8_ORNAN|nr:liver carboxylesterase 1 [Ornithorhynchus anatinus]
MTPTRRLLFSLLLSASLTAFTAQEHDAEQPVVDTKYGKVQGKRVDIQGIDKPVGVFLGIPFAKPPLGELRFAPPQPAVPWNYVKEACSYPPMCIQEPVNGQVLSDLFTNRKENISLTFSEDCLYLNIYTPADLTKSTKFPVMVWIHGGGLVVGGASTYDGLVLSAFENVVVVTIQYRLGIFGFFSTGDEHAQGNWGYLDQVAALQWVQENIANFGGDPDLVTIFGESAGAVSVSALVLSPLAKNLFHRAISESGSVLLPVLFNRNIKPVAKKMATVAGCKTTTSASMVHCLRQRTEEEILETTIKMDLFKLDFQGEPTKSTLFVAAVVDGVFFPKSPEELLAEKKFNPVPYIIGINNNEFGWLLPTMMQYPLSENQLDRDSVSSLLWSSFPLTNISKDRVPAVVEEYLGVTDDPARNKLLFLDMLGDLIFGIPSVRTARFHRASGAPTYMYEYQHRPSSSMGLKPDYVQADHGDELNFVFGGPFLKGGASVEESKLSRTVMKYWSNFARNGNPNGEGLVTWPAYDQREEYLQIGLTQKVGEKLKDKRVAFWTKIMREDHSGVKKRRTEL